MGTETFFSLILLFSFQCIDKRKVPGGDGNFLCFQNVVNFQNIIDKRKVPGGDGNKLTVFAIVLLSIDKRKVPGGDGNALYSMLKIALLSIDKRKVPGGDGNSVFCSSV